MKPDAPLSEYTWLGLKPNLYNYNYDVSVAGSEANAAGEYVLTAPAECDYIFYYESGRVRSVDADGVPFFSAKVTHIELGDALMGQTTAQLTATQAGNYLCQVSWPDGTALNSEIVAHAPQEDAHVWGTAWSKTLTHHWHECIADGCGLGLTDSNKKGGYEPHTYEDDFSFTCTECGDDSRQGRLILGSAVQDGGFLAFTETAGGRGIHVDGRGTPNKSLIHFPAGSKVEVTLLPKDGYGPKGVELQMDGQPFDGGLTEVSAGCYTFTMPEGNVKISVYFKALNHDISGTVTDHEDNPLEQAEVKLVQGGVQVGESVMTDAEGRYAFTGVPEGRYNVVATKGGVTKTVLVELTEDVTGKTIKMPDGNRNSVVEVKGGNTPAAVVGGVDAVAEAEPAEGGDTVTVTLTIEAKDTPEDKAEIDVALNKNTAGVLYLDLSFLKQVNGGEAVNIPETWDNVLEIVIPYDFTGKENVTVYRKHGEDNAEALVEAATGADGTYALDKVRGALPFTPRSSPPMPSAIRCRCPLPARRPAHRPVRRGIPL